MEDHLADVGLQRYEERSMFGTRKQRVEYDSVLHQAQSQSMEEYKGSRPNVGSPAFGDTEKVLNTVVFDNTHVVLGYESSLNNPIPSCDEEIPYKWAPSKVDRVESEQHWSSPRVCSRRNDGARSFLDELKCFLEKDLLGVWQRRYFCG